METVSMKYIYMDPAKGLSRQKNMFLLIKTKKELMPRNKTIDDLQINPLNLKKVSYKRRTEMKVNNLYFNY